MDRKPSPRIVAWLRDFDPHMRIRWSPSHGAFSIERKARISDRLMDAVQRRCDTAYNPHEPGSVDFEKLEKLRRLARLRLEAAREGYETICTIPDCTPTDEAELIEYLIKNDPWRYGHPDTKGSHTVASMLADEARQRQMASSELAEKSARRELAERSKDLANDVFLRLGSTVTFSDRSKGRKAKKNKRGKVA